ncbi:MAG TPA: hypothetical protein V6D25_14765 [Leptolyngbyaceae cyanobacterium]
MTLLELKKYEPNNYHHPISNQLIAHWIIVDNKLVCKWMIV